MTEHVKMYGVKPRIQYIADGTSVNYEFPFAIFDISDIDVYFGETLQNTSSYTVSPPLVSEGGSITFKTIPEAGTIITIVRNLSIERTSDFQEGGALRAKVLNDEFDYQIACLQQIAENLNRSMVLPPYATDSDVDLTLPRPEAGKAVVWNKDGTTLENSSVKINELESTLREYKTCAENAADIATTKAGIATEKAQIATNKATEVSEVLSTKANTNFDNVSSNLDYVTESYGPDTNGMWYRIYKSGWIEQGGYVTNNTSTEPTINFLKPFSDTEYFTCSIPVHSNQLVTSCIKTQATASVTFKLSLGGWLKWYACGY